VDYYPSSNHTLPQPGCTVSYQSMGSSSGKSLSPGMAFSHEPRSYEGFVAKALVVGGGASWGRFTS
jgi:hypothetical protein